MRWSSSQYCMQSLPETSARLPAETNVETPRPRRCGVLEHRHRHRAGLAEQPDPPGRGQRRQQRRVEPDPGSVLTTPHEFGPTTRMPLARATRTSARCRSRPSGPVSAKPPLTTTSPRTPARAHSCTTSSTDSAGTAITARSSGRWGHRDVGDRTVGGDAEDGVRLGVHDVQRTGEVAGEEVLQQPVARRCPAARLAPTSTTDARREQRCDAAELRPVLAGGHDRQRRARWGRCRRRATRRRPRSRAGPRTRRRGRPRACAGSAGRTSATKRWMPCSRAAAARCSSSTEPMPRPCWASATLKATSAVPSQPVSMRS